MKKKEKQPLNYEAKLHYIGKAWTFVGILLFLAVPVTLCIYYKTTPNWAVFGTAAVLIPMIINICAGIVEPIIYAPMLGINGEYLAFITGNLSNLKIPCVVKAQEIAGTKLGTEENELVSTIAIATSSLITVLIIAIGVLCLAFTGMTEAIKNNKFIYPAFGCVVYALFGSLGGKYLAKNPKLAIFPTLIIIILSIILGVFKKDLGSVYLFIGIGFCALFAFVQYKIQKKKMKEVEEEDRLKAIAAGISYEEYCEQQANMKKEEAEQKEIAKQEAKKQKKENFKSKFKK